MAVNYKDTLNLPKTSFPMKANLASKEPDTLRYWDEIDIYKKILELNAGKKKFVLTDGPPYANGDIHIGHAMNKVLKDMILKSKHFSGFQVPYVPGWDCHGLPIEHKVEKKYGRPGGKISESEFRRKCREFASSQVDKQRISFMRLGVFADWFNPYLTMQPEFEAGIIKSLGKVVSNGHLTRGERPVHWCTDCGSALAEAEVEYKNKLSPSIEVCFKIADTSVLKSKFNVKIASDVAVVIWTTTPWTLVANAAVCVHPDFIYVLIEKNSNYFVVAKDLSENFIKEDNVTIVAECAGRELEHMQLRHPFQDRVVPIILGNHVTTEAGTGCVHTAPAHGLDDFAACKSYGIEVINPVATNGCYKSDVAEFYGLHVFKANKKIIELLQEKGVLVSATEIDHSYPHCWRHKTPLIFLATPQWFINMEESNLRKDSLETIKKMQWSPTWGQERIKLMVESRPNWCISRQRSWGTPIPFYIHKDTGQLHPDTVSIIDKVADLVSEHGLDIWYDIDDEELIGSEVSNYIKVNDTLDVWFDAGLVHACVAERRSDLHDPADLYLEGSDQYRGWFQSSLLTAVAIKSSMPCKQIVTHGFTVDASGRKMSKSLGNTIEPDKVIKSKGADILRLWSASVDYTAEIHVSEEILKRVTDVYRKIRNTSRFLLANIGDFNPDENYVSTEKMLELDLWLINKSFKLQQDIIKSYADYQFHAVLQSIHNFCTNDLGAFYLDIIKDRQYTCSKNGIPRRSAQTAMYHVTLAFTRWIAPILCFTAEEIWKYIPGDNKESVFLTQWYAGLDAFVTSSSIDTDFWQQMLLLKDAVNKELEELRNKNVIGSPLEAEVTLYAEPKLLQQLERLGKELKFLLITSGASVKPITEAPKNALSSNIPGLSLILKAVADLKCERCWHRVPDVGKNSDHPNICTRCIENLGEGEVRNYV